MINVAIVEDEDCAANNLSEYLNTFGRQNNTEIKAERFRDAISLLTGYSGKFDIVFMDIELPEMNGMDAAKKLREIDMSVTLVFVTNMAQYAVKGYEVGAVDYIVKPVSYYDFSLKLRRIVNYIQSHGDAKLALPSKEGMVCIPLSRLKYVEVRKHTVMFHTEDGEFPVYGTLKKAEDMIRANAGGGLFVKCNSCYFVNLRFVTAVRDSFVIVGDEQLNHCRLYGTPSGNTRMRSWRSRLRHSAERTRSLKCLNDEHNFYTARGSLLPGCKKQRHAFCKAYRRFGAPSGNTRIRSWRSRVRRSAERTRSRKCLNDEHNFSCARGRFP